MTTSDPNLYLNMNTKRKHTMRADPMQQWPSHQRLNVGHPDGFRDWLAGFRDGDRTFWFAQQSNQQSWDFTFKIGQRVYNQKVLAYIKKKLKCGSITSRGTGQSQYRLRNPYLLYHGLVPLLDSKLLTRRKRWDFMCFKEALKIYHEPDRTLAERNRKLQQLEKRRFKMPESFQILHPIHRCDYPPAGWILGFTEAEGSFYLVQKQEHRIVHGVGWIQADEKELLEAMKQRFQLAVSVKRHVKGVCWILDTTSAKSVETLIPFFTGKLKGMKSVEFQKWARSYRKHKGHFVELSKLQSRLRQSKKFLTQ